MTYRIHTTYQTRTAFGDESVAGHGFVISCPSCQLSVEERTPGGTFFVWFIIVAMLSLSSIMTWFGGHMLADAIRSGLGGGNDPIAEVLVLVVLLGLGVPVLVASLFRVRYEVRNWRDLARCTQIPRASDSDGR